MVRVSSQRLLASKAFESSSYHPGARFCGLRPLHLAPLATSVRRAAPPLFIPGARPLSSGSPPPARAHTSPGGALLIKQAARVRQENWTLGNLENLFKIFPLRDEVQRTIHLHLPPPLSIFTPLPNAWYSREHRSETLLSGIYLHFFYNKPIVGFKMYISPLSLNLGCWEYH